MARKLAFLHINSSIFMYGFPGFEFFLSNHRTVLRVFTHVIIVPGSIRVSGACGLGAAENDALQTADGTRVGGPQDVAVVTERLTSFVESANIMAECSRTKTR